MSWILTDLLYFLVPLFVIILVATLYAAAQVFRVWWRLWSDAEDAWIRELDRKAKRRGER